MLKKVSLMVRGMVLRILLPGAGVGAGAGVARCLNPDRAASVGSPGG